MKEILLVTAVTVFCAVFSAVTYKLFKKELE